MKTLPIILVNSLLAVWSYAVCAEPQTEECLELRRLIGREQFTQALSSCMGLIEKYPNAVNLYESLAEIGLYARGFDGVRTFLEGRIRNNENISASLYALAMLYHSFGKNQEAVRYYEKAIEAGIKTPDCYRAFGDAYEAVAGVENAIETFGQIALRYPDDPRDAYALAMSFWTKPDYVRAVRHLSIAMRLDSAEVRYREAIAVARMQLNCSPANVSTVKRCLDEARLRCDYNGSFFLYTNYVMGLLKTQTLDMAERGVDSMIADARSLGYLRWLGWALMLKADLRFLQAEYGVSMHLARESIVAYRRANTAKQIPFLLRLIFQDQLELGDYENAIASAQERLELCWQTDSRERYIEALSDLALAYHQIGLGDIALEYSAQALARAEVTDVRWPTLHISETTMGLVQEGLGRYTSALNHYLNAMRLVSKGSFSDILTCVSNGNLGNAYLKIGKIARAGFHYDQQFRLCVKADFRRELPYAYSNLGRYYRAIGRVSDSEWNYERAIELCETMRALPLRAVCERELGDLLSSQGELEKAKIHYELAFLTNLQCGAGIFRNHSAIASDARILIQTLCTLQLYAEAFRVMEQAQFIREEPYRILASRIDVIDGSDSLCTAFRSANRELARAIALINQKPEGRLPRSNQFDQPLDPNGLSKACLRQAKTLQLLAEKGMFARGENAIGGITVQVVQQSLPKKSSALLEYVLGRRSLEIFLVTRDTLMHSRVEVGAERLAHLSERMSGVLRNSGEQVLLFTPAQAAFNSLYSDTLYRILIGPFESVLSNYTHLIIVPDGCLKNFPFEALTIAPSVSSRFNVGRKRRYLIEFFEISYQNSALYLKQDTSSKHVEGNRFLAVGNPRTTMTTVAPNSSIWLDDNQLQTYESSLPGAEREARRAGEMFGRASTVLLESEATKRTFIDILSQYDIVHVASHAFVDGNNALNSGIVFAQDPSMHDGSVLRAFEILDLDLGADLVVLSACNTGRSSDYSQFGGVAQALKMAGASAVVSSLWSLEDESSARLMETFYGYLLKGETKSRALQLAKIELIQGGKADPYFWAGYLLVGNACPISLMRPQSWTERRNWWIGSAISGVGVLVTVLLWRGFLKARPNRSA